MAYLGKTYKLEKQENYEEFVDSFVAGSEERKEYLIQYKPDQRLEKDGDDYILFLIFGEKERRLPFKSGVAFEEELKGVKLYNTFTIEGDIINQEIKSEGDYIVINVMKEFSGDKLVETITNTKANVVAKRYYSA